MNHCFGSATGRGRGVIATLEVVSRGVQPAVGLGYLPPVRIDAGDFPNLMLMQTCLDGSGTAAHGDASAVLRGFLQTNDYEHASCAE